MWRNRNGNAAAAVAGAASLVVRHFSSSSRKRAPNLRKINPKVSYQEAASIAQDLYGVIKSHGPITVSNTWNQVKEVGISGLNSKTHMRLMLHWMRGRRMLKLFCQQVGSSKKFLLTTLPEEPHENQPGDSMELKPKRDEPSNLKKQKA